MTRASRGAAAEAAAAAHLRSAGLEVLAANVRVGRLEVDLLAREGDVIALVEVRTRGEGAWVRALDSIDAKKRDRLRRAGERLWRDRFAKDPHLSRLRFDALTVELSADGTPLSVEHLRAFFV